MATAWSRLFARRRGIVAACTATGARILGPAPACRAFVAQSVDRLGGSR